MSHAILFGEQVQLSLGWLRVLQTAPHHVPAQVRSRQAVWGLGEVGGKEEGKVFFGWRSRIKEGLGPGGIGGHAHCIQTLSKHWTHSLAGVFSRSPIGWLEFTQGKGEYRNRNDNISQQGGNPYLNLSCCHVSFLHIQHLAVLLLLF